MQAAIKRLPWVRGASVRRIWPGTLVIRVSEHTPYARWGTDGLISTEGVVFRPASIEGFEELPLMAAADEYKDEVLEQVEIVNRLLGSVGPVTEVTRNAMGGWSLQVASGLRIELGVSDITKRLSRVKLFIRQFEEELDSLELLDARYANGIAVRLKPVEESENENSKGGALT